MATIGRTSGGVDDTIGAFGLRNRFTCRLVLDLGTGCWLWFGGTDKSGYGYIRVSKKLYGTHRYAWTTIMGAIPEGMEIDHMCQNRHCANPAHMQVVTPDENKALAGKRRTHCAQGHAYEDHNTTRREGYKRCKQCQRDASANYSRRKKASR